MTSGIRQGCPLSGTIFALCMDPFLRWHIAQRFFAGARIFAFADDVAMALKDAERQLPEVARAFGQWARASGLRLKARICVFLPVWEPGEYEALRAIAHGCREFVGASICTSAKYLGSQSGVYSGAERWRPVISKALQRARDIVSAGASMPARVAFFIHTCRCIVHVKGSLLCSDARSIGWLPQGLADRRGRALDGIPVCLALRVVRVRLSHRLGSPRQSAPRGAVQHALRSAWFGWTTPPLEAMRRSPPWATVAPTTA